MAQDIEALKTLLSQHNYSLTQPRQVVFKALQDQEPLTIQQLIATTPKIDRASIYRTVSLFEQIGVVQRLQQGWKYKIELSDAFAAHHHHLSCTRCKKIIPINEQALEQFIEQLAIQNFFVAQSHQVEIQGLCKSCAAADNTVVE
jgi:Fur family transcriptional regulator, ferric uptake regulator